MFMQTIIALVLICTLMFMIKILLCKSLINLYSDNPFECGVSSNFSSRKPYSLPFFFISIIFLMFDMEIILVFPLIFMKMELIVILIYIMSLCLIVLSLILEWYYGSLTWLN